MVSVPQAVINPATRRLIAETSSNWLDLFNFMRIFRQRAKTQARKIPGLESNPEHELDRARHSAAFISRLRIARAWSGGNPPPPQAQVHRATD